jgi:hypothetical protein
LVGSAAWPRLALDQIGSAKSIDTKEVLMAVVYITEFAYTDMSTANYDWAREQIGDDPVDGLIVHTAGFDEDAKVFRIIDVWESQEQADRFIQERIKPVMEQGVEALPNQSNTSMPTRETIYELHDVRVSSALASPRSSE